MNAIAALSAGGIVAVDLVSGSVNGEKFFTSFEVVSSPI